MRFISWCIRFKNERCPELQKGYGSNILLHPIIDGQGVHGNASLNHSLEEPGQASLQPDRPLRGLGKMPFGCEGEARPFNVFQNGATDV